MEKPKIRIKLDIYDVIIELLGVVGLILLIVIPMYYYSELPEIIPSHFGIDGEPDNYSNKMILWTLPIIGILMYVGLYFLSKKPHLHNYSEELNEFNFKILYKISSKMIRTLNSIIIFIFVYIIYSTIQTSLKKQMV